MFPCPKSKSTMFNALSHPSAQYSHSVAFQVSQQASSFIQDTPSSGLPWGLWSSGESSELWTVHENLVLSCLRTGDEASAKKCLQRLTQRFGTENERLMALTGVYKEALAQNDAELQSILEEYNQILLKNPANITITKRRIALLKSLGRPTEAIIALNQFLETSPTDPEAWSEASDLYVSQGLYQQAIFALEEVILITPFAWNIQARLGEVLYMTSFISESTVDSLLAESIQRFCRSIELCDDYLRGYYGLKLVTDRILTKTSAENNDIKMDSEIATLNLKMTEKLNKIATAKLSEIVSKSSGGHADWQGYDKGELTAAQELLGLSS